MCSLPPKVVVCQREFMPTVSNTDVRRVFVHY